MDVGTNEVEGGLNEEVRGMEILKGEDLRVP